VPFLVKLEEKRGHAFQYGLGNDLPAPKDVLPTKDELCNFVGESGCLGTVAGLDLPRFGGSPENLMNGIQARAE
jgi:hypothetical protein